jgi:hypothetical protein
LEGFLVISQLTGLSDKPVEMVTRKIRSNGDERGMLVFGYKFRPVLRA